MQASYTSLLAAFGQRFESSFTRMLNTSAYQAQQGATSSPVGEAAAAEEVTMEDSIPHLIVLGGNGYVGSHVCQEALRIGIPVTSINRTGKPTNDDRPWVNDVNWFTADAMHTEAYKDLLARSLGVVSCIGLISTSQASMQRVNGDCNVAVIEAAAEAGVERFAYISAHDYQFPGDLVVLKGYFEGKRAAEAALQKSFPQGGVALRPGFIHGTRRWGNMKVPLGMVGAPLESLLKMVPNAQSLASVPLAGAAFVPPVSVETVAKAAVAAATDPSVPAGVMDVWKIAEYTPE